MNQNYKWHAMSVVSIGVFMSTLDGSIVNVALPTITRYFNTDIKTMQWVLLSYLLTITLLLLSAGRLSDIYGKKPIFSTGILIFTIGSGLCSLSLSEYQLIFFRMIQGIGASMIMATGPAIIISVFPYKERGRALGLIGTIVSIGSMIGPVIGGILIDFIGWQSIFYINIPVGLFGILYSFKVLKKEKINKKQSFDFKGMILISISIISLIIGVTFGQDFGWKSITIIGLFIIFITFLILFILLELKIKQPLIDLSLFKNRSYTAANISSFLSFIAMFSLVLLIPYYMQEILGYSTRNIGFAMISIPLVMSLIAPFSGWIFDKTGSYIPSSLGMAVSCLALFLIGNLNTESNFSDVVIRLGIMGLGLGLFHSPNNTIVMSSVPNNRLGTAAGLLAKLRNLGMVIGLALSGAIFNRGLSISLSFGMNYNAAFISGFHDAFMVSTFICGIGIFTSLVRN